jgi:hypothetical protein
MAQHQRAADHNGHDIAVLMGGTCSKVTMP